MSKPKILIQVDPDQRASSFDSIVAIDSGVDHLLVHSGVDESEVESLVHGAIFTRGADDLKNTAFFFGGRDVTRTALLVSKAKATFFGPMKVSFMSDPNGANTTAAAAVLSAQKHLSFENKTIIVLAGTGPVGMRIAHLVAGPASSDNSVTVKLCSRSLKRAEHVCDQIRASVPNANLVPVETASTAQAYDSVCNGDAVFAAGAAGVELLSKGWQSLDNLKVAIDVNGVPPVGIFGIDLTDKAEKRGKTMCYGAIGVGGLKMKIHKRCIQMLFESNDQKLEVEEIFAIGQEI